MKYLKLFEEIDCTGFETDIEFKISSVDYVQKVCDAIKIIPSKCEIISEGANGFAVDLGNKVLKVTSDMSEAYYANKLIDITSPNLVDVECVYKIESNFQYDVLYVIVMEKLNTNLHTAFDSLIDMMNKQNKLLSIINNGGELTDDMIYEFFKGKIVSLNKEGIIYVFNKWLNVYRECKKYNLPIDDFRSKNTGISKRNKDELVFFDISNLYSLIDFSDKDIKVVKI